MLKHTEHSGHLRTFIRDARLARTYVERANKLTGDRLRQLSTFGRELTRGSAMMAREYRQLSATICERAGL